MSTTESPQPKTERCPECEGHGVTGVEVEPGLFRDGATTCNCCDGKRVVEAGAAAAYRERKQRVADLSRGEAPSKALVGRLERRIEALATLHDCRPCSERDFLAELLQEFHRLDRLAYRRACAADKPEPGA